MPNEINITINGRLRTLRGWPATAVITAVVVFAAYGLIEAVSAAL